MKRKLLTLLAIVMSFVIVVGVFAACEPAVDTTSYTVTFDANDGTLTGSATVTVEKGKVITGAPTAARDGYTFNGWYSAKTDGTKIDLTTYTVSEAVTLYAQWTVVPPTTYAVTFDANGGKLTGSASVTVEKGKTITGAPTASRNGHDFEGWFTDKTAGTKIDLATYTVGGVTTLYAQWKVLPPTTYAITFDANGGTLTGTGNLTIEKGKKITGAPIAERDGYDFNGWYTAKTAGTKINLETYSVIEPLDLFAQWSIQSMPITKITDGYRIEAEDAIVKGEPSQAGSSFIETTTTSSGGKSLGYLSVKGNTVTFTFNAAAAGKADISAFMSSGALDMTGSDYTQWKVVDSVLKSTQVALNANGTAISYPDATLRGSNETMMTPTAWNKYWDPVTISDVSLVAGLNKIVVESLDGTFPNFDRIEIKTTLTLTAADGSAAGVEPEKPTGYAGTVDFDLVVGAYAGGPAVEKAIIKFGDAVAGTSLANGDIVVSTASKAALGTAATTTTYLSDKDGKAVETATSNYVTIEYDVSYGQWSFNNNLSPFTYSQATTRNTWSDLAGYSVAMGASSKLTIGGTEYGAIGSTATFGKKIIPSMTDWRTDGTHTKDDITLTYGAYEPDALKNDGVKNALIIWLHGGGEGGTDPSIAILGNQITNLSGSEIQGFFAEGESAGAYVLAPQAPTMWMEGIYNPALWSLIKAYVTANNDIDTSRIVVGGCSNGGYMTIDLLLTDTENYFAAFYPICEGYSAEITADKYAAIKDRNIWLTHSLNDGTLPIAQKGANWWEGFIKDENGNYIPTDTYSNKFYVNMLAAGATNTHYTLFDSVVLDSVNYDGHWSWINTLLNKCTTVQAKTGTGADGAFTLADLNAASTATVKIGEKSVSIWEWMAAQRNTVAG